MKWFEYKQETDALHAPEALKARLLAMQAASAADDCTGAGPQDAPAAASGTPGADKTQRVTVSKPRRAPIRLPWKRIAALAACFALGVVMTDIMGWQILPRMGSANFTAQSSGAAAGGWGGETAAADAVADTDAAEGATSADNTLARDASKIDARQGENTARKIIYTARLTLETKAYDETVAALETAAETAGGYVESQDEDCYSNTSRYCTTVFRIPSEQYDAFLTASADAGSLVSRSETAEDITANYMDADARVQALATQRDRLLEMQQSAETLSDLLEIENQLTQVQYQLESWQAQLDYYSDQVRYCTVTVEVREVTVYTPTDTSFAARLGSALTGALQDFGAFFADLALWLAGRWPWVILVCAAAGVGLAIRRRKHLR